MGFLAHRHREIELIYVREGKADISIGNTELAAHKGDLIVWILSCLTQVLSAFIYHHAHSFRPLVTTEMFQTYDINDTAQQLFDITRSELKEAPYYQ